jgi:prepilin-type N-terminal cleavage/methylation domain-containing protein/prepilin-type processing-associated H-X9-DG protein
MSDRRGFTLVELLVVVGIIGALLGILLPMVNAAWQHAERAACARQLKQLMHAVHAYGVDNKGKLPSGTRDGEKLNDKVSQAGEHCIWISHATYKLLVQHVGSPNEATALPLGQNRGDSALACPNLHGGRRPLPEEATYQTGWIIGYNYLGGHQFIPGQNGWKSPLRMDERGSPAVFADLNEWCPAGGWTIVGHRRGGGGGYFESGKGGQHPRALSSVGGNVAFLDGSVVWRNLDDMQQYETSHEGPVYFGLW